MNRQTPRWSFVVESLVLLLLFVLPMYAWIGYVPREPAAKPTTDERRLAFQVISEALKAGITMLSIGFGLNGLLVALRDRVRVAGSYDLILAVSYGMGSGFFGVWGLLALPQYVHGELATQNSFFGFVMAAHFSLLLLAFWRLGRFLIIVIRDREVGAVQLGGIAQSLDAQIREIDNLKKLLARVEIKDE